MCTSVMGDHLSCETTFAWPQGWSPIAGFTVPSNATSHKKQQNIWFRGRNLNSFQDMWALSVLRGTGQLHMVMTYIP
jgi:hypothetical protein